jgi:ribokinase
MTAGQAAGSPVVVVVGPVTQDISMLVDEVPGAGASVLAREIRVAAGGKGGNPAAAARALGPRVRLFGAVGDDAAAAATLEDLSRLGIDVRDVIHSTGEVTGQIVHIVEPGGRRRYFEAVGANRRLMVAEHTVADACGARAVLLLSTSIPRAAARAAVDGARAAGAFIVADLAGEPETSEAVLAEADVVRGNAEEIGALAGYAIQDIESALGAGRLLLARGPRVAGVGAGDFGDVVLSAEEEIRLPRLDLPVVDPTGSGDAFVATLAVLLGRGAGLAAAARMASAAAAHTATHLGGRPDFTGEPDLLEILKR